MSPRYIIIEYLTASDIYNPLTHLHIYRTLQFPLPLHTYICMNVPIYLYIAVYAYVLYARNKTNTIQSVDIIEITPLGLEGLNKYTPLQHEDLDLETDE